MKRSSPAPAPRHTNAPLGTLQTQPPAQRHEATTPFIPPATKIIITRHQPQICLPQNTGRRQTRAHKMATRRVHKRLHTTSRCSDCRTGCPQSAAQPLGFCPHARLRLAVQRGRQSGWLQLRVFILPPAPVGKTRGGVCKISLIIVYPRSA